MQNIFPAETKLASFEINPLNLSVTYNCGKIHVVKKAIDSHFHNQCEIYVNISGNVSFMVEDRIYAIESGDVIITRPYEKHHCIYHHTDVHDHFCIMLSYEKNEEILAPFFKRESGVGNLISLSKPQKEKLLGLCTTLVEEKNDLRRYIAFFSLIDMLSGEKFSESSVFLPDDVRHAIEYIGAVLPGKISVEEVASAVHVTVNTLERHFRQHIGISPHEYIRNCRLADAQAILENGGSVTDAAMASGFSDYSHFIALFKKKHGITPKKFQQNL